MKHQDSKIYTWRHVLDNRTVELDINDMATYLDISRTSLHNQVRKRGMGYVFNNAWYIEEVIGKELEYAPTTKFYVVDGEKAFTSASAAIKNAGLKEGERRELGLTGKTSCGHVVRYSLEEAVNESYDDLLAVVQFRKEWVK